MTECGRLSEELGVRVLLKREDLTHTGSHKINNVIGQGLLTLEMGKTRLVAETGAGQHGVATATAAALFGLECVVYMGEVDTERQALNVFRMRLLGAEVRPVSSRAAAPSRTRSTRPCGTGSPPSRRTHYCLGSVMGPHPYPWMVREFQRVVGDEAREQCRAVLGGADPDLVVACVGGGSNAAGTFAGFVDTPARLVGVEAAGGSAIGRGIPGVLHGMRSYLLQDEWGQILEAAVHLRRSRLPGHRSRARLPVRAGPGLLLHGDRRRGAGRLAAAGPHRGDHPRPGAGPRPGLAGRARCAPARWRQGSTVLVTLSGRGDKDAEQVMRVLA